jgi:hypothetical protein
VRHSRIANIVRVGGAAARRRLRARVNASRDVAGVDAGAGNWSETLIPDAELWPLGETATGFGAAPVSHGTARDFAEVRDVVPLLLTLSPGLPGLQRGWALKALVGALDPGARVLEIAGGDQLAAGLVSRLGHRVTIVDPFDGSATEPGDFATAVSRYPDLEFVRSPFPPSEPLAGGYDAVFSTALLERLEPEEAGAEVAAARDLLAPGGVSAHAFAHVIAGWGEEASAARVLAVAEALGIDRAAAESELAAMKDDPQTYLVSAETHDDWRGSLPYDRYPMRRIGSIHLFARADS